MTVAILGEMGEKQESGQVQKGIWMGELEGQERQGRGTNQERRLEFWLDKVRVVLFTV